LARSDCVFVNAASFILRAHRLFLRANRSTTEAHARVRFFAETMRGRGALRSRLVAIPSCDRPIAIVASPFISLVPAMAIITLHSADRYDLAGDAQGWGGGRPCPSRHAKRTSEFSPFAGRSGLSPGLFSSTPCPLLILRCGHVLVGELYMEPWPPQYLSPDARAAGRAFANSFALYAVALDFYPLEPSAGDLARSFACAT